MKRKLLIAVLACAACDPFAPFNEFIDGDDTPQCSGSALDVNGTWRLSGEGKRENCDEGDLNTDGFALASTLELPLVQVGTDVIIDLDVAGFTGSGTVNGSCLELQTREGSGDEATRFDFIGTRGAGERLTGPFEGTGPGRCESSGTFELRRVQ